MNNSILYIIDDDKDRQMIRYKSFIDIDSIKSERIKFIYSTIEVSILAILETACCVCIHDSMRMELDKTGNLFDFEILKKRLREQKIPKVIFSNQGNQMTDLISNIELNLRSDDFYMNLSPFIKNFESSKNINLEILALGKNYRREKALQLKSSILNIFRLFDDFEPISLDVEDKKQFREMLNELEVITNKKGMVESLIKKLNAETLTKCIFENDINLLIKFLK